MLAQAGSWEIIFDGGNLEVRTQAIADRDQLTKTMGEIQEFMRRLHGQLGKDDASGLLSTVVKELPALKVVHDVTLKRTSKADLKAQFADMNKEYAANAKKLKRLAVDAEDRPGLEMRNQRLREQGKLLREGDFFAQPQVTFGLPLEAIAGTMEDAAQQSLDAYKDPSRVKQSTGRSTIASGVPAFVLAAVKAYVGKKNIKDDAQRASFLSLILLVVHYIIQGRNLLPRPNGAPPYAKSYFEVMTRTDFRAMYNQLGHDLQRLFDDGEILNLVNVAYDDEVVNENEKVLRFGAGRNGQLGPNLKMWLLSMQTAKKMKGFVSQRDLAAKASAGVRYKKKARSEEADFLSEQTKIDKKIMDDFPQEADQVRKSGRSLGERDLLSRGEVLFDSSSMGAMGTDREDPRLPGRVLNLLELRGLPGEIHFEQWSGLAEELFAFYEQHAYGEGHQPPGGDGGAGGGSGGANLTPPGVDETRWADFMELFAAVEAEEEQDVPFQDRAPEALDPRLQFAGPAGGASKKDGDKSEASSAERRPAGIPGELFELEDHGGGGDCVFHALEGKSLHRDELLAVRAAVAAQQAGMETSEEQNAHEVVASLTQTPGISADLGVKMMQGKHRIPSKVYAALQATPGVYTGPQEILQWCRLGARTVGVIDTNGSLAIYSRAGRQDVPKDIGELDRRIDHVFQNSDIQLFKTANHYLRITKMK